MDGKHHTALQLWGHQTLNFVSLPQTFTGDITVKFQFYEGELRQARVKEAEFPITLMRVNQPFFDELKKT